MTKVERIDSATCRMLAREIDAALREIADRHGLAVQVGGGKYESGYYEPKVRLAVRDAQGTAATPEAAAFRQLAQFYGLKQDDLGRTFESNGRTYRLVGLKARSDKYPFLAADVVTGKAFKFTSDVVRRGLGIEETGKLTLTDPPTRSEQTR